MSPKKKQAAGDKAGGRQSRRATKQAGDKAVTILLLSFVSGKSLLSLLHSYHNPRLYKDDM